MGKNCREAIETLREIAQMGDGTGASALAAETLCRIDPEWTEELPCTTTDGVLCYSRYILPGDGSGKMYLLFRAENETKVSQCTGLQEEIRNLIDLTAEMIAKSYNDKRPGGQGQGGRIT
ncbi:MAG: hypothetical protein LUE89_00095 [Clostridiales bacterium]|nr:hypothetical protein [Clostridiales bacterium]